MSSCCTDSFIIETFVKTAKENGDSICHSSFLTENFQHVSRGSEKAGLAFSLLGAGTGKLAWEPNSLLERTLLEVGSQVLFQIFGMLLHPGRSEHFLLKREQWERGVRMVFVTTQMSVYFPGIFPSMCCPPESKWNKPLIQFYQDPCVNLE